MAYSTLADLLLAIPEATLIQLTDDAAAGEVNENAVSEAIATADSEIDGWCQSRYEVSFTDPPALIKKLSVDLAIYNLYSRWSEVIPETRTDRYKNAQRILEKIATGAITLGSAAAAGETSGAEFMADDRLFTRTKLKGM